MHLFLSYTCITPLNNSFFNYLWFIVLRYPVAFVDFLTRTKYTSSVENVLGRPNLCMRSHVMLKQLLGHLTRIIIQIQNHTWGKLKKTCFCMQSMFHTPGIGLLSPCSRHTCASHDQRSLFRTEDTLVHSFLHHCTSQVFCAHLKTLKLN